MLKSDFLTMHQEENNMLKIRNEDLSTKLRRTENILSRVKDELASFRVSNGRNPYIDFDEEKRLSAKLKVSRGKDRYDDAQI